MKRETGNDGKGFKPYSELTFTDDFMFCKVMTTRKDLCKRVLELILNVKIKDIRYINAQYAINPEYRSKGIRLDVYVDDDEGTVYNIEMQAAKKSHLPKRTRYYQSVIDTGILESGMDYDSLPRCFIIFICTFDWFGHKLPQYTFLNTCQEDNSIVLDDQTTKIFINPNCIRDNVSDELCSFFDLLKNKAGSNYIGVAKELYDEVELAKNRMDWRGEYMHWDLLLRDKLKEGYDAGHEEGYEDGVKVIMAINSGKTREELLHEGFSEKDIEKAEKLLATYQK